MLNNLFIIMCHHMMHGGGYVRTHPRYCNIFAPVGRAIFGRTAVEGCSTSFPQYHCIFYTKLADSVSQMPYFKQVMSFPARAKISLCVFRQNYRAGKSDRLTYRSRGIYKIFAAKRRNFINVLFEVKSNQTEVFFYFFCDRERTAVSP